ncbi:MAG: bifunctional transaldolase/phosoglucose isomerase [Anaerolineales bacterium]|nr:bifunctional transaldolase/phosoglucose isomerase [Anaerolineales bacterium]
MAFTGTAMNPIQSNYALGQSLWLDNIRRDSLESGELADRIAAGDLCGVTFNPGVFESAILSSDIYSVDLRRFAQAGWTAERIFNQLAIDDVRTAADAFLPLFEQTNGKDGFVSIDVNPEFADDPSRTIEEARRLWGAVNRPNTMINIPATLPGISALESLIRKGINVNATLIFSLGRYIEVMEAYMIGLEGRLEDGGSLDHVTSVASFFVSRIDTALDERLQEIIQQGEAEGERASFLLGKVAIANSRLAYAQFVAMFQGERFQNLSTHGARVQRPLWASTGTKDSEFPDTYYVDHLIGPETINALSEKTLKAFKDYGKPKLTLTENISTARSQLQALDDLGISLPEAAKRLERQGVQTFVESHHSILRTIEEKAGAFKKELAALEPHVRETLAEVARDEVGKRLWQEDVTLWAERDREKAQIRRWLGWLSGPAEMSTEVVDVVSLAREFSAPEISALVLIGSGCGSFAAEMLARILAPADGLDLHTLRTANPDDIRAIKGKASPEETLYLVVESSAGDGIEAYLLSTFWEQAVKKLGEKTGDHFIVVTKEGSKLQNWAVEQGAHTIVKADLPDDPWRSPFHWASLLPAALAGGDLPAFVRGGTDMTRACGPLVEGAQNPGLFLGAALAAALRGGRDKVTLIADPPLEPMLPWIESLLAAGRGRGKSGYISIRGEPAGSGKVYGEDRLFVYLRASGALDSRIRDWIRAGIPVIVLETNTSAEEMGEMLVQWQIGAAIAQHLLSINPIDLDSLHRRSAERQQSLHRLERKGGLPHVDPLWQGEGVQARAASRGLKLTAGGLSEAVDFILAESQKAGGLGMRLYAPMSQALQTKVARLRCALRDHLGMFSLAGFAECDAGSTRSLKDVVYLILMVKPRKDAAVPGKTFTFGQLNEGQALSDLAVLKDSGSHVLYLYFDAQKQLSDFLLAMTAASKARNNQTND